MFQFSAHFRGIVAETSKSIGPTVRPPPEEWRCIALRLAPRVSLVALDNLWAQSSHFLCDVWRYLASCRRVRGLHELAQSCSLWLASIHVRARSSRQRGSVSKFLLLNKQIGPKKLSHSYAHQSSDHTVTFVRYKPQQSGYWRSIRDAHERHRKHRRLASILLNVCVCVCVLSNSV